MTAPSWWCRFRWGLSSMRIRWTLIGLFALVVLGCAAYGISLYYKWPVPRAVVRAFAAFATAFALLTALAGAFPRKRRVKMTPGVPWLSNRCEEPYRLSELPEQLSKIFKHYGKEFYTYRINFNLTNDSGFDLKDPIVSVELPANRGHPWRKKENGKDIWTISINNSIIQMGPEPWVSENAGTIVLTGRAAVWWNRGKPRQVWVRVVLKKCTSAPFRIQISVNCENAEEGFTDEIEIKPEDLLDQHEARR